VKLYIYSIGLLGCYAV